MKRVLFLTLFSVFSICASAQSVDSLKSAKICIDSLSTKLNKLQHDYDFLCGLCELERAYTDMRFFKNTIEDYAHEIRIDLNARSFDVDLYIVRKNAYDTYVEYSNTLKENTKLLKEKYEQMINSEDFSSYEYFLIKKNILSMETTSGSIISALNMYKICLEQYKKLGLLVKNSR